jgi:hypothetical protein
MREIPDVERRARLATRHAIAPGHRVGDAEAATRAVAVLHSTEPATVHLSVHARVDGVSVKEIEKALYDDRSLVKQLAMRRTLFVFPRDLLPAAWGSASARVAGSEWKRMVKDLEKVGVARDGARWLRDSRAAVLELLGDRPEGLTALEIREAVPRLVVKIDTAGAVWSYSRVLTHLGCTADLVRGSNTQHWRLSRPRWCRMGDWLDETPEPWAQDDGWAELVRRWLAAFGPGTEDDIVWWLGATKAIVRAALARLEAVEVGLEGGATGWVLPGDDERVAAVEPWAALLPVLDPTVMGWKERQFYLGPHTEHLFDRNGNAGTTAWWDGRIVGAWVQDDDGVVAVRLLEPLPKPAHRALAAEAGRLSDWLDGVRIGTVYPSKAMKATDWVHPS